MKLPVIPIGKHNLDTQTVETLAKDLAKRLNLNIIYGYIHNPHFDILLEESDGENTTVTRLGEITSNYEDETWYWLYDDQYQHKQLLQKFGPDILYDLRYWKCFGFRELPDETRLRIESREFEWQSYTLSLDNFIEYGNLHFSDHLYINRMGKYYSSSKLNREFLEGEFADMEKFMAFRRDLLYCNKAFGGEEVYYLDDRQHFRECLHDEEDYCITWAQLKDMTSRMMPHRHVDISRYFTDESYKKAFIAQGEKPYLFIDDFRDLKEVFEEVGVN